MEGRQREAKTLQKYKIMHNQQTSNVPGNEMVSISSSGVNTGRDTNALPKDLVKSYLQTVCDRKRTCTFSSYYETSDFESIASKKIRKGTSDVQKRVSGDGEQMVQFGTGKAMIPTKLLEDLAGSSYTIATRKLLTSVFSRQVLATHSLTGKRSPAFPNKPARLKLDPVLVDDIVRTVVRICKVPASLVRKSITTKCADESKMLRSLVKNK